MTCSSAPAAANYCCFRCSTTPGTSDGGPHCGIICDASMTTYLLSHWVGKRTRRPGLSRGTAVYRLAGDPAAFYGLGDRGVLVPDRRADVNPIDLDGLALHYPERVEDLPGGPGRLVQRSDGYARPGGLVRRRRATPSG